MPHPKAKKPAPKDAATEKGVLEKTSLLRLHINAAHVRNTVEIVENRRLDRTALRFERTTNDTACAGLMIKLRKRTAAWVWQGPQVAPPDAPKTAAPPYTQYTLGEVRADDDPDGMRERVRQARVLIARGVDPRPFFTRWDEGSPVSASGGGWLWDDAVEKFLAAVRGTPEVRGKAFKTWDDYRKNLLGKNRPHFGGKYLADLVPDDLKRMQYTLAQAVSPATAAHMMRVVSSMLTWCAKQPDSGIAVSTAKGVPLCDVPPSVKKGKMPTADMIGKMPWLTEYAPSAAVTSKIAAAIILLTVQRRETVFSARRADFKDYDLAEDGNQIAVWHVPPLGMKVKGQDADDPSLLVGHMIPMHPILVALVRTALAIGSPNSEWLFPQLRVRRVGDAGDGHQDSGAAGRLMLAVDVGFTPHDFRKRFGRWATDVCQPAFSGEEVKAVLDHGEGESGNVTREKYSFAQQIYLKKPILDAWTDYVLAQVRRCRPDDIKDDLPPLLSGSARFVRG